MSKNMIEMISFLYVSVNNVVVFEIFVYLYFCKYFFKLNYNNDKLCFILENKYW